VITPEGVVEESEDHTTFQLGFDFHVRNKTNNHVPDIKTDIGPGIILQRCETDKIIQIQTALEFTP